MADAKEMWEAIKSRFGGNNDLKARDNDRRPAFQDDSKALVTIDGENIDWSGYSPPITENYMPSGPDAEIYYSKFTYGSKQTSTDESRSKPSEYASCEFDSSVETTTSMHTPVEIAPKVVCEPKVWTDAPIIEDYESDSDNDSVFNVQEDKEKPSEWILQESREKNQKLDNNGHKNGKRVNTPRCDEDSNKLKELMVLCSKLSNMVLVLEQSKTAQDLVIKKLQKKVKRIERKIKARTSGMTLFKIGNFRRKSLDKENVSKHGRYLKTRPMFEESNFDNIDDMVDEDND
nr:hypothetical protein [Tanacetum cinerariifolium]